MQIQDDKLYNKGQIGSVKLSMYPVETKCRNIKLWWNSPLNNIPKEPNNAWPPNIIIFLQLLHKLIDSELVQIKQSPSVWLEVKRQVSNVIR